MTSQEDNSPSAQTVAGGNSRTGNRLQRIFISYRHVDSAGHAGHIHEKLATHFGRDRIFMDVDNLPPGMRFDQHIQEVLGSCSVLLAIIGRYWLTLSNDGNGAFDAPQGWMRTELATALKLGVPIVPVLVHGAEMPRAEQLPEELVNLVYWQAVEIRDKNFQYDVEQLIKAINEIISSTRLDRYKLGRRLGGGRSGEVFFAEDTLSMGRTVAVKKLHPQITQNEQLLREFEGCARAICGLDSPNILRTYDIGQAGSCHFIVTEYFDGPTLRRRLASSPIRLLDAIRITRRVAEALSAAHRAGLIHGDIRPENVLVNSDYRVKVFDFGLAELVDQVSQENSQTVDAADAEIRRINYKSPEQLRGDSIDERTDIWNVGVMLHEIITERLPFDGSNGADAREVILNRHEQSLSFNTGEEDIETELCRIVGKALCRKRDERYQSAKDLTADLDELEALARIHLSRIGTSPGRERRVDQVEVKPPSPPIPEKRFWQRPYLLAIVAAALLVIGAAVVYYFSAVTPDSIAILPATIEGDDPMSKAIASDITRNIQTNLLGLRSLSVKDALSGARTHFDCRIELKDGELRVYAELREARTGKVIAAWQPPYTTHVADWKVLTQQFATDIVRELNVPLTKEEEKRLRQRASFNRGAAELYLGGRASWQKRTKDDFYVAITKYDQAARMDPQFALAYVGLADSYHLLPFYDSAVSSEQAFSKAEAAINNALALDDDLLEAYISRAMIRYQYKRDFAGAAEDFDRLMKTEAYHYATGWQWFSEFLLVMGKHDEANEKARIALEYDQHSPIVRANLVYVAYYARDYKRAIEEAYDAIKMFPYFRRTYIYLATALEQSGQYDQAIINFAQGGDRLAAPYSSAPQGKWKEFLKAREKYQQERPPGSRIQLYEIAETYARLDNAEEALKYLRQAIDQKSNRVVFIGANPRFRKLCGPQFLEMVKEVGVPAKICEEVTPLIEPRQKT
jgi:serine/threonine protein kinase/tetratricopeptide (TPR) repeat protein